MTGTITRVFLPRGFAFVRGEDGQDYFFQADELHNMPWEGSSVREGATVRFTPTIDEKRKGSSNLRAAEVSIVI